MIKLNIDRHVSSLICDCCKDALLLEPRDETTCVITLPLIPFNASLASSRSIRVITQWCILAESDNESVPSQMPVNACHCVKVKTLEEIKLEKVQEEAAAYYSYPGKWTIFLIGMSDGRCLEFHHLIFCNSFR